jgi:hypothetical protein
MSARSVKDVPDPCAPILRRILRDGRIDRVEVHVRERGAMAYAMPSSLHPAVTERIKVASASAASLADVERAYAEAGGPVANGRGRTVLEALQVLDVALKAAAT